MQCDGLICRGTSALYLSKSKPSSSFASAPPTNRISFPTNFPTRTRLKVQAAINDGFVKPPFGDELLRTSGYPRTISLPEIKQAYKQLARKYHPDVSPPDLVKEYTERFIRVQEAYETLSDPRRRAIYDTDMARGLHLAFSARKNMSHSHQETEDKSDWKIRWEGQLSELKKGA